MSIDILLAIVYTILVRNKREHKEKHIGLRSRLDNKARAGTDQRDWDAQRATMTKCHPPPEPERGRDERSDGDAREQD